MRESVVEKKVVQEPVISVPAITHGTVIDHIAPGRALVIAGLLQMFDSKSVLTLALNLSSKTMGRKDLIKVSGRELTRDEAEQVAALAPRATVNIIRDFRVFEKYRPSPPKKIRRILVCPNEQCVTRRERIESCITVSQVSDSTLFRCHYCERKFSEAPISL